MDVKEPINIAMFDMFGPERKWQEATYPFIEKSNSEIYAMHTEISQDGLDLYGSFELTEDELRMGKEKLIQELGDASEESYKVCLILESSEARKAWGKGDEKWKELEEYLYKKKALNIKVVKVPPGEDKLVENLAMMKHSLSCCT
jgi:hypothetical protein